MEKYFVSSGVLVPYFHLSYYMGMRAATRPYFNWLEPAITSPWKLDGEDSRPQLLCCHQERLRLLQTLILPRHPAVQLRTNIGECSSRSTRQRFQSRTITWRQRTAWCVAAAAECNADLLADP